jgi:hypothetical protein
MTRQRARARPPADPSQGLGFGEPPTEKQGGKYDWDAIADRLRRKPGVWLCVFKQDRSTYASTIWQGNLRAIRRDLGFEIRTANNTRPKPGEGPRLCDLWLRYVPEKDPTKESTT